MVLAGLRLDSAPCASDNAEAVPPKLVSDSAGMAGSVAECWGKVFERAPTEGQKLRLNQFLDRFAPQRPVVELPRPSLHALERAAARAPPSAHGPDQLPCAAWRRSPDVLRHLHALMEQFFNEGVGPHDLNWSIFLCVPRETETEDTPDTCTRTASTVCALSLKNADAKLIASCADRALQSIASAATDALQKGFAAGRRFVGRVPFLDAECHREGFLPGAAQRRPMLLSYDSRQAFPPLFRDVIDMVLPRYGVPNGFRNVVSALCCNCLFGLQCGIMQGCPLSGTVWCLGMGAPIRALIEALGGPPEGCLTACADDLGMLIRNARVPPSMASSIGDIEFAFNLQLAIHKFALVPRWAEVTPSLISDTSEYLAVLAPRWSGSRIDSCAKYLGTRIGPGISEQGIWKEAAAKWWPRAAELSRAGMATSLAAIAYNVNVLPCLSYLAQFFFLVPEIWRVEFTLLHRLLLFPPSSMRKADILSMGAWCGSPAPVGLLPYSVATPLRAAAHATRGWVPALRALHEAAVQHLPLVRVLRGALSPTWWATRRAIVQTCGLVMDQFLALPHPRPELDKVPAPVPAPLVEVARRATIAEELAAARAVPPRKAKRQAAAMRTRGGLYDDRLDQLIGRRLRRCGLEAPAEELRARWLELRAELRVARPSWLWSRLHTVVNGWITSCLSLVHHGLRRDGRPVALHGLREASQRCRCPCGAE
ncbi:unnamed protein product [Prorocentrum cordatum]|uniref:RNA-directed DNA polymerase n=1 Tax=Prorocentrum cordatum TaxID=2364126 RepID=A0ABN9YDM3_9DINO|nr:unnamed protein product [Polarella glacialis]